MEIDDHGLKCSKQSKVESNADPLSKICRLIERQTLLSLFLVPFLLALLMKQFEYNQFDGICFLAIPICYGIIAFRIVRKCSLTVIPRTILGMAMTLLLHLVYLVGCVIGLHVVGQGLQIDF